MSSPSPVVFRGVPFGEPERQIGRDIVGRADAFLVDDSSAPRIEAEVRHFSRRYFPWVEFEDGRVTAHDCDCAHFENTGLGCEHLFALMLLLDSEEEEESNDDDATPSLQPRYAARVDPAPGGGVVFQVLSEGGGPLSLDLQAWTEIDDPRDIAVVRRLAAATEGFEKGRRGGALVAPRGPWRLASRDASEILLAAAATGRLALVQGGGVLPVEGAGEPMDLVLALVQRGGHRRWVTRAVAGPESLPIEDAGAVLRLDPVLILHGGRLLPLITHGGGAWIATPGSLDAPVPPPADPLAVLEKAAAVRPLPRVALRPEGPPLPLRTGAPTLQVDVASRRIRIGFSYGGAPVVTHDSPGDLLLDAAAGLQWRRDRDAESEACEALVRRGAFPCPQEAGMFEFDARRRDEIVETVFELGGIVRLGPRRVRPGRRAPLVVRRRGSGLVLTGGLMGGENQRIPLVDVLRGMARGEPAVPLDGTDDALWLGRSERDALTPLVPLLDPSSAGGSLVVEGVRTLLAAAILRRREIPGMEAADDVRTLLEEGKPLEERPEPSGFRGALRPYQRLGLSWMSALDERGLGGCLADEMGLGKTPQVLAECLRRNERGATGPHLIVVPRSLLSNWEAEASRFAPALSVVRHAGPRRRVGDWPRGTLVLTTYGVLRRDAEDLQGITFDLVALDEAQAVKNARSETARAARRLEAKTRLAVTGTPVENDLGELLSLMSFFAPGLVEGSPEFRRLLTDRAPGARRLLGEAIRPLMLRRRKDEVLDDLPDRVEATLFCDMHPDQASLYGDLESALREDIGREGQPARVLEALLRLRQIACHPALVGRAELSSGKLEMLLERLDEARSEGRKALVFSQFTSHLDLVAGALDAASTPWVRLDGRTRDRDAQVRRFQQDEDVGVFLISLRAGGTGLNLTAADLVFLLDPWWNPAVEDQAISRAHRMGRKDTVFAYRLVSRGTVEERMLALQAEKSALAQDVLDIENADMTRSMDLTALRSLLG